MVTVGEGLLLARSYADKYGYATSPNRDLLAFGGANLASGLSSGFTIGSATSRAAAMDQAGSRITFAYSRVRPQLRANLDRMQLLAGHLVFDTNRAAVAALRPPPKPY